MLGAGCRVCVSCGAAIDPAQIMRPSAAVAQSPPPLSSAPTAASEPPKARFSWQVFLVTVLLWLTLAVMVQSTLSPLKAQIAMGAVLILTSVWVFYDAHERGIRNALRWGVGSLLLWIVVFPWYLSRRRSPDLPCSYEGEISPLLRVLLVAFLLLVILGMILMVAGPAPKK
jgi:hypothetical protein